MEPPILKVDRLVKSYGRRRVVDGVSLSVSRGEIVGLLGPNGAGKTTSFRMTCGLIDPDRGNVYLSDLDVTHWPMHRRARDGGMGYLAQEASVFRKLTVEQNLLSMMELLGMKPQERKERCQQLLEQFEITHIRKSRAAKLSGGERRRLEIARCLISNPSIILLDEPFAGIDPVTVQGIQEVIQSLSQRGIAVLITDHAAREILQIVDRCYVIYEGKVLCEGPPEVIENHEDVRRIYLGNLGHSGSINQRTDSAASSNAPSTHSAQRSAATPRPPIRPPTSATRRETSSTPRGRGIRFISIHEQDTLDANEP